MNNHNSGSTAKCALMWESFQHIGDDLIIKAGAESAAKYFALKRRVLMRAAAALAACAVLAAGIFSAYRVISSAPVQDGYEGYEQQPGDSDIATDNGADGCQPLYGTGSSSVSEYGTLTMTARDDNSAAFTLVVTSPIPEERSGFTVSLSDGSKGDSVYSTASDNITATANGEAITDARLPRDVGEYEIELEYGELDSHGIYAVYFQSELFGTFQMR